MVGNSSKTFTFTEAVKNVDLVDLTVMFPELPAYGLLWVEGNEVRRRGAT